MTDRRVQAIGLPAPVTGALRQPQAGGDARQPVATRPADDCRKGMHGGQVTQFPGTGIRLIEDRHRQPPQFLQALEQDLVPG